MSSRISRVDLYGDAREIQRLLLASRSPQFAGEDMRTRIDEIHHAAICWRKVRRLGDDRPEDIRCLLAVFAAPQPGQRLAPKPSIVKRERDLRLTQYAAKSIFGKMHVERNRKSLTTSFCVENQVARSAETSSLQTYSPVLTSLRARPEIIESTSDRVKIEFTTTFSHHIWWL